VHRASVFYHVDPLKLGATGMSLRIEVVDDVGNLKVPLPILYALLRRGAAKLSGRYLEITSEGIELLRNRSITEEDMVPEVEFCPSGEPQPLDVDPDDPLAEVCADVYRYFPGDESSRCAACAIKVYSALGETWLVSEKELVKILEVAKKYGLPIEWNRGNVVYTTCPPDYRDAQHYPPGSYREGLEKLRQAARELLESIRRGGEP